MDEPQAKFLQPRRGTDVIQREEDIFHVDFDSNFCETNDFACQYQCLWMFMHHCAEIRTN